MLAMKIKLTHWVLVFSSRFPWLVPRLLRFLGQDYGKQDSEVMREIYNEENRIKTASIFEGRVSWKGISFVAEIGREDLGKVHKWMSGQPRAGGNYSSTHEEGIKSKNLIGASYNNLGFVSFDRPTIFSVGSISIAPQLPKSCYISLLRLKNGACYISLYVKLDDSVNSLVSNVDVRHISRYKVFQSFNPFSPRFAITEHHDRRSVIEKFLYRKANEVVGEAKQAIEAMLEAWGVKRKVDEFSLVADFFREGTGSYFDELSLSRSDETSTSIVVIERHRGQFLISPLSEDTSEEYIENYIPSQFGVDAIFLKSQVSLDTESYRRYDFKSIGITDNYTYTAILAEIYSRFQRCTSNVSPVFLSHNKKEERDLKKLLDSGVELNVIEERLTAVEEGLHWCEERYRKFNRDRIHAIRSHVSSFRKDVERRRDLNNGKLQVKNLIWMRRYSIMVFLFVLVQITLSLLNVDWTDAGRSKNPIYINLFQNTK